VASEGLPAFRVEQILRWVYQRDVADLAEMTDVGKALRQRLAATFSLPRLPEPHVVESRDGDDRCVFCVLPHEEGRLRENLVVARGRSAFVILNKYHYNSGHLLVIPYRHTADLTDLTEEEHAECAALTVRSIEALRAEYRPEGFNLGTNLGKAAGAGIAGHLHHHIVPRWAGDTNFLPVLGETKSIPEHLLRTWDRLAPHFAT